MKKLLKVALLSLAALLLFSCDPIEPEFKVEEFLDNIYTVNKHTVTPEYSDSAIYVANIDKYGLVTGDRVHMTIRSYFDLSTMGRPLYEIVGEPKLIETLPLSQPGSTDTAEYSTPFSGLHDYEFIDRYVRPEWVWKNRQNLNISYFGIEENAAFAMEVRGAGGDCIEFNLYAKAARNGNKTTTRLLTFDLSGVEAFLSDEQKANLAGIDSVRTRIYFKREKDGKVDEVDIIGGKIANPVK